MERDEATAAARARLEKSTAAAVQAINERFGIDPTLPQKEANELLRAKIIAHQKTLPPRPEKSPEEIAAALARGEARCAAKRRMNAWAREAYKGTPFEGLIWY